MAVYCGLCDRSFSSDEALKQHKKTSAAHDFQCTACNRRFTSAEALQQHTRDSPAHAASFACDSCNRSFSSEEALQQHIRDSPAHAATFDCEPCNRSFNSEEALQQHIQNAPAHAPSFDCESCDRSFSSEEALQQHTRDSPAHAPSFDCNACNRSFNSEEALQKHMQDSPVHAPSFDCEACNRSFNSGEALQQHLSNHRNHQQPPETPLDVFFLSFHGFDYDPSTSPAKSWGQLRRHMRWPHGDPDSEDAWDRYQDALERELRMWYGAEDSLAAWHVLCRAIGVEPLPQTCELCEKVRAGCTKLGDICANVHHRLCEKRMLTSSTWLNGGENVIKLKKRFARFARWESCGIIRRKRGRYSPSHTTKKIAMSS